MLKDLVTIQNIVEDQRFRPGVASGVAQPLDRLKICRPIGVLCGRNRRSEPELLRESGLKKFGTTLSGDHSGCLKDPNPHPDSERADHDEQQTEDLQINEISGRDECGSRDAPGRCRNP